jgi:hypothetical protein
MYRINSLFQGTVQTDRQCFTGRIQESSNVQEVGGLCTAVCYSSIQIQYKSHLDYSQNRRAV